VIVTCESCSTSFQLDESRIPATGARLRCSRCKHAFFIASPAANAEDVIHSIAAEAAEEGGASVSVARDLEDSWNGLSDSAVGSPEPAAETPPEGPMPGSLDAEAELDEEDWHFSEEVRIEGDEFEDEEKDPSDAFDALSDPVGGFEIGALSSEVGSEEPEADPLERDDSSFGSVEDFSSWMEDEEPSEPVGVASLAEDRIEAAADLAVASGERAEDLGEPESWDLLAGDDEPASHHAPARGRRSAKSLASELEAVASDDSFAGADDLSPPVQDLAELMRGHAEGLWGRCARSVGWLATTAALLWVGYGLFQAEARRWAEGPVFVEAGPVRAQTEAIGWVETSRSGDLLRVVGALDNAGREALVPGALTLFLLDADGDALAMPGFAAGEPLTPQLLRESEPGALALETADAIDRLQRAPLDAAGSRPFEILIPAEQLPESAARYRLRMDEPSAAVVAEVGSEAQLRASSRP
jgi:predicted Zn finger-like uncharacterized protein